MSSVPFMSGSQFPLAQDGPHWPLYGETEGKMFPPWGIKKGTSKQWTLVADPTNPQPGSCSFGYN